MPTKNENGVFDGIAVMERISGNRERFDIVAEGIAKMRDCAVSAIHDMVTRHFQSLRAIAAPLVAYADVLAIMAQTPNQEQAAKIEALRKPVETEFLAHCIEQLALTEGQAHNLMQMMVGKRDN